MAINALQSVLRGATGKELQFTGDFHAYWDQLGIPPGQFAERMAAWKALPQNAAWIDATADADAADVVGGLWGNGEQGVWYDASDLSTMFQDAAGTLPVYAPGQGQVDPPVGRILDKSGRGNHAYQTTTTSRPTLSARYNWATFTEDLTASVWQKGAPAFTITPKATLAPDGVSLADIVVSPDSGTPILSHVLTAQAPSVALSFFIKPISNATALSILFRNNTTATNYDGTTLNTVNGTAGVPAWVVTPAGNGWLKISYARTTGIKAGDQISIYAGAAAAAAVPGRIWSMWGLDVRSGNDGVGLPPYQRVKDANTYDTAGFPLYLRFDGVDDSLLTADIDFSTVNSTIAVSTIRKLSDASRGIVFELGGTGYSSPGSFNQEIMSFSANVSTSYSGATGNATSTYPCIAPFSAVMSSAWNLSAPLQTFRVNGVLRSTSTVAVGGGMFQKAPLFIGRRNNSSVPFNGRLYGLIVRSGATPDATITRIERYLNSKARAY